MKRSNDAGRQFEDDVVDAITRAQWTVHGRNVEIDGIEVDILAEHPADDRPWFIECKGGTMVGRSGLARTDTAKKTIGAAWGLRRSERVHHGVYFVATTYMPRHGSLAHGLLLEAVDERLIHGAGTIESLLAYGDFLAGRLPGGFSARPVSPWGAAHHGD